MERLTKYNTDGSLEFPHWLDENEFYEWAEKINNRLSAYEDAEEQGRIVVLPCAIGTKIYRYRKDSLQEIVVGDITFSEWSGKAYFCDKNDSSKEYWLDDVGKLFFLSREAALKAQNGGVVND